MSADIITPLKALHCYGMASAGPEYTTENKHTPSHLSSEAIVRRLIDTEAAERQARGPRYQLKSARFPAHRDFIGFNRTETPQHQAQIEQLATAGFTDTADNLILAGGTGAGKTHLAIAPGVSAIHHGRRVRFFNAADLANLPLREKQQDKTGAVAR